MHVASASCQTTTVLKDNTFRINWTKRFERQRNEGVSVRKRLVSQLLPVGRALCDTAADDEVASKYDSARVSVTVTSQVMHFPACHGICVNPSGRFPSDLKRPAGSLTAGTLARPSARHTRSFSAW